MKHRSRINSGVGVDIAKYRVQFRTIGSCLLSILGHLLEPLRPQAFVDLTLRLIASSQCSTKETSIMALFQCGHDFFAPFTRLSATKYQYASFKPYLCYLLCADADAYFTTQGRFRARDNFSSHESKIVKTSKCSSRLR